MSFFNEIHSFGRVCRVAVLLGLISAAWPAQAQVQAQVPRLPSAPATPQQPSDAELKAQFGKGFTQGCLTSQGSTPANKQAFCSCLLNAYQTRYSGQALASIVVLASQAGPNGPKLVDLLMLPERRACLSSR